MTLKRTIALGLAVAIGASGCMQLGSRPSRDADLAAITAFNKRYLQAINDGDFATLSSLTVEDHIMMAPNRPAIVGKAANDEANGRAFEQFRFSEQWVPQDTVIDGDLAYQRGTFTTSATPKQAQTGSPPTRSTSGKFLRIYRRLPDRSWTMVIDMFNSDPPGGSH
jgi:ketosteroid isomerase-like protein